MSRAASSAEMYGHEAAASTDEDAGGGDGSPVRGRVLSAAV